jgi:CTP synthase (UTP-ammonia lyase)
MNRKKKIALVTEYDPGSENHRATINAVEHVRIREGTDIDAVWVSTRDIKEESANFDGFWFTAGVYKCPDDVIDTVRSERAKLVPPIP